jgi:hypothetical protein
MDQQSRIEILFNENNLESPNPGPGNLADEDAPPAPVS